MLDAVVIGGGAAGLAAAAELARAGASFVLLEARGRLGGRAWTERAGRFPVELGAEFVHGRPAPTLRELRRARLHARRVPEGGGDERYWERIERALKAAGRPARDRSFADALRAARGLTRADREAAWSFVRSFHAADPRRIGAREVAEETTQGADESLRVVEGYRALTDALARRLPRGSVVLNAPVRRLEWSADGVRALAGRRSWEARAAVVTLPVGVLASRDVAFSPRLPAAKRAALRSLGMGDVAKVGLLFKASAWPRVERALRGFLHDERGPFSVYWSARPLDTPLATAWAGGPPARALCRRGARAATEAALRGLARCSGIEEAFLRRGLVRAYFHDWTGDPWSRGAYSYAKPGGLPAREELGRPVGTALYFAGEACALRGTSGTVAGALESGRDAARLMLRSRKAPPSRRARSRPRRRRGPSGR